MESGTFPTHIFGPNLKWWVCFAQHMRDKPQLLHDRLPHTDPGMAAPQPVRLHNSCMASTTQGHSQHRRVSPGKKACWILALLMYCSGNVLSKLLQPQRRADAIPVLECFRNSLEHLLACGSSQRLSVSGQPTFKEHGMGGMGRHQVAPLLPH